MNPEKVICKCKNVTKGDILKAIDEGARTFKAVQKITGAGSKCGKCEETVRSFIKKHRPGIDTEETGKL